MTKPRPSGEPRLGDSVRQARERRGWTQTQLAERAGVSRPTVARIEAGQDVSMATLTQVARSLGLILTLVERR